MKKFNYLKATNVYELEQILTWIENTNRKLILGTTINNCIYVFYEIIG